MPITEPAPVTRDDQGFWFHPDLPLYEEGEQPDETWTAFCARTGIESRIRLAEDDLDDDVLERICSEGDCSEWEPTPPEGDGWYLIAINDTDDGPIAGWARPREA